MAFNCDTMVQALWYFLLSSPETSVPFPWERCFDGEILFYRNPINGSMVLDLRSRINLGGGLFHFSSMWHDLTGRRGSGSQHFPVFPEHEEYEQDPPFLIAASCCGPVMYLLVPEMISLCPICNCQICYFS